MSHINMTFTFSTGYNLEQDITRNKLLDEWAVHYGCGDTPFKEYVFISHRRWDKQ